MMEKLVKTAITGVKDSNDPTNFRANPQNMIDNVSISCCVRYKKLYQHLMLTLGMDSVHVSGFT